MENWWFRNTAYVFMLSGAVIGFVWGGLAASGLPVLPVLIVLGLLGALLGSMMGGSVAMLGAIMRWWL